MSEAKPPSAEGGEFRRKYERLPFRFPVTLRLDKGLEIRGESRDVAVRGLFLVTSDKTDAVQQGMTGFIVLDIQGEKREFHCVVAHSRPEGLGIYIDRNAENFGFTLTNAIFGEASLQLGAGVRANRELQLMVTAPDNSRYSVRVIKISTSGVDFCLPRGRKPLSQGSTIALTVQEPGAATSFGMTGIVTGSVFTTQHGGGSGEEMVCSIRLGNLGELEARRLKSVVLQHHRENLDAMMQRRAMANTLLGGGDRSKPNSSIVRSDLQKFFPRRSSAR